MGRIYKNKNVVTKKSIKVKKNGVNFKKRIKKEEKSKVNTAKQYSEMTVDDFLSKGLDELSTDSESNEENEFMDKNEELEQSVRKEETNNMDMKEESEQSDLEDEVIHHKESLSNSDSEEEENNIDVAEESEQSDSEDEAIHNKEFLSNSVSEKEKDNMDVTKDSEQSDSEDDIIGHKESLAKLKDTDPEFYEFLRHNDKNLLDFNLSDSDNEDKNVEENGEDDETHRPPDSLEVASDESDFEDDTKDSDNAAITLKMLKTWQSEINTDKTNGTIIKLIKAFHAAILRVSNSEDDEVSTYKVEGSSVFNGVVQICVLELGPALRRYLRIPPGSKQPPHKSKKFVKVKAVLRGYFVDLLKLLVGVTSTNILSVLLKHLHYMSPMIVSYGNVLKQFLKKLIRIWGTADETVRVIAFFCILRLVNIQQQNNLDMVLKTMYMTYVQNSKFVSPSALPMINFMRRSLVEMFTMDINVSYQHAFLYIRQLAIHLRNAITVKKKENIQAVYNWQFVNSLKLWGNLLSATSTKPQLQPLIYPFVQVCLGTINLIPTTQYYPLRFHVTEMLIDFSNETQVFIPILPFLLEILTSYDFNRKHQKVSMKPLQLLCILRLSKSQMVENGFKDAVIDAIYGQILEYMANYSHSIAFPDLSLLCVVQIKAFLKKCSVAAYCRKMRQILEKIEQNNKFIIDERKTVTFNLTNSKQIEAWETVLRNKGTPLSIYYQSWKSMKNVKRNKEATNNVAIGDYNLPILRKGQKPRDQSKEVKSTDKVVLFPSDSESDDEAQEVVSRPKRGTRGGKNVNKKRVAVALDEDRGDDVKDVVEDLKISDW